MSKAVSQLDINVSNQTWKKKTFKCGWTLLDNDQMNHIKWPLIICLFMLKHGDTVVQRIALLPLFGLLSVWSYMCYLDGFLQILQFPPRKNNNKHVSRWIG